MWGALGYSAGKGAHDVPALLFYGGIAFVVACGHALLAWIGWILLVRPPEADSSSCSPGGT
jgi:hypothetical protein